VDHFVLFITQSYHVVSREHVDYFSCWCQGLIVYTFGAYKPMKGMLTDIINGRWAE